MYTHNNEVLYILTLLFKGFFALIGLGINIISWLINVISNYIFHKRIASANSTRRGVDKEISLPYSQCVSNHIPRSNCIVSSSSDSARTSILSEIIAQLHRDGMPVICLHMGNQDLEKKLKRNVKSEDLFAVNTSTKGFSPFKNMPLLRRREILLKCTSYLPQFSFSTAANDYLRGVELFLEAHNRPITLGNICKCIRPDPDTDPADNLYDWVDIEESEQKISRTDAAKIKRCLTKGEADLPKLINTIEVLENDILPICKGAERCSFYSAITDNKVLLLDMSMLIGEITQSFIFTILQKLNLQYRFSLVIDSLDYSSNKSFSTFVKSKHLTGPLVLSSENLYSMIGGDEKEWKSIIGASSIIFAGHHAGGDTAEALAKDFGTYERFEQHFGSGQSINKRGPTDAFGGSSHNSHEGYAIVTKSKVTLDDLQRLNQNEFLIKDPRYGIVEHVLLYEE